MERPCTVCNNLMSEESINQAADDAIKDEFGSFTPEDILSEVHWSERWDCWVHRDCESAWGSGLTASKFSMKAAQELWEGLQQLERGWR
jgi:hypothetical protein